MVSNHMMTVPDCVCLLEGLPFIFLKRADTVHLFH